MAYMSQENKKKIAEELKKILKGSGLKYTLGVRNHSTLVMKIKSGSIDFLQNYFDVNQKEWGHVEHRRLKEKPTYLDVNHYWYHDHFTYQAKDLLEKIVTTMNMGNHDNSDSMTDYVDVGWYVNIKIGTWDNPYQVVK